MEVAVATATSFYKRTEHKNIYFNICRTELNLLNMMENMNIQ